MRKFFKRFLATTLCVAMLGTSVDMSLVVNATSVSAGDLKESDVIISNNTEEQATVSIDDESANILYVSGGDVSASDIEESVATITSLDEKDEWEELGILPYENYRLGERGLSGFNSYDRLEIPFFDFIVTLDADKFNPKDAELIKKYKGLLRKDHGEISEEVTITYIETLEEVIACAENGMDLNIFSYGTTLAGITLEELYELRDEGKTLDDYMMHIVDNSNGTTDGEDVSAGDMTNGDTEDENGSGVVLFNATNTDEMLDLRTVMINEAGETKKPNLVVLHTSDPLGRIPGLSAKNDPHDKMWHISIDGSPAFCTAYGKGLSSMHTMTELDYNNSGAAENALKAAALWLLNSTGYNDPEGFKSMKYKQAYLLTQCYVWWTIANGAPPTIANLKDFKDACNATKLLPLEDEPEKFLNNVNEYYKYYCGNKDANIDPDTLRNFDIVFWANGSGEQTLFTIRLKGGDTDIEWEDYYGYFFIKKNNEDGMPLAGCEFTIFDPATMKEIGALTTDESGEVRSADYYLGRRPKGSDESLTKEVLVIETSAPDEYEIDKTIHKVKIIEDKDGKGTKVKTLLLSDKPKGPYRSFIKNVEGEDETRLSNGLATYQLYTDESCTKEAIDYYGHSTMFKVGGQSPVTIYLKKGTYWAKEIVPPEGCLLNPTPVKVSVTEENCKETVKLNFTVDLIDKPITLNIKKVAKENPQSDNLIPLPNAKLSLSSCNAQGKEKEMIVKWTTGTDTLETSTKGKGYTYKLIDDKNTLHIEEIPAGWYMLEEIEPPDGYTKADAIIFEVKEQEETQEVVMEDGFSEYKVLKIDADTKLPLPGAHLELYEAILDDNGEVVVNPDGSYKHKEDAIAKWISTDEAKSIIGAKPYPTKYILVETKAPDGYDPFDPQIVEFDKEVYINGLTMFRADANYTYSKDPEVALPDKNGTSLTPNKSEVYKNESPLEDDVLGFESSYKVVSENINPNSYIASGMDVEYTFAIKPGDRIWFRALNKIHIYNAQGSEYYMEDTGRLIHRDKSWYKITYNTESQNNVEYTAKTYLDAEWDKMSAIYGARTRNSDDLVYNNLALIFPKQKSSIYPATPSNNEDNEATDVNEWTVYKVGYDKGINNGTRKSYDEMLWRTGDTKHIYDIPFNANVDAQNKTAKDLKLPFTPNLLPQVYNQISMPSFPNYETDPSELRYLHLYDDTYIKEYDNTVKAALPLALADVSYVTWDPENNNRYNDRAFILSKNLGEIDVPDDVTTMTITLHMEYNGHNENQVGMLSSAVIYRDINYVEGEGSNIYEAENHNNGSRNLGVHKVGFSDKMKKNELAGAVLQIIGPDGNVVENGEWTTDGSLKTFDTSTWPNGTYTLHEKSAPAGYKKADDQTFTLSDDSPKYIELTMEDAASELNVSKVDPDGNFVANASLALYLIGDDGTETKQAQWLSGSAPQHFEALPYGKYVLKEIKQPGGYIKADDVYFDFTEDDNAQLFVAKGVVMTDKPVEIEISKKDATNNEELNGAGLIVYKSDKNGNKTNEILEQWVSGTEPHILKGVMDGTYYLVEDYTPLGYATSSDVKFEVKDGKVAAPVVMYDKRIKVEVEKHDKHTAEAVPGAKLALYSYNEDADGLVVLDKLVERWTSDGTPHLIEKLPIGKYVIVEEEAPIGYEKALYLKLEVKNTGDTQNFVVEDDYRSETFIIKKVDENGEPIKLNAEFTLEEWSEAAGSYVTSKNWEIVQDTDNLYKVKMLSTSEYKNAGWKDGRLYWTPDNQGKFRFFESKAPDGYILDTRKVEFNILDNKEEKIYGTNYDQTFFTKKLPDAFMNAETTTEISKKSATTGEELPGCELKLYRKSDMKLIDEWTSTTEVHVVKKLVVGVEYLLRETKPTDGYTTANDVTFVIKGIDENGAPIVDKAEMTDEETHIDILKIDADTNEPLAGATLQLWTVGADGKPVDMIEEWTTTTQARRFDGLVVGKKYLIKETAAPDTYSVAADMTFTVKDQLDTQTITFENRQTSIEVLKLDASTKKPIAGAKLQLWTSDNGKKGEMLYEWTSSTTGYNLNVIPEWVTEKDASYPITGLEIGKEYILTEVEAPNGYKVAADVKYTVKNTNKVQTITMYDKKKTKKTGGGSTENKEASLALADATLNLDDQTGEVGAIWMYILAIIALLGGGVTSAVIYTKKRRKVN